jgi:aryl-alcohol dehydrogenase-like predicted oxidoreductase
MKNHELGKSSLEVSSVGLDCMALNEGLDAVVLVG